LRSAHTRMSRVPFPRDEDSNPKTSEPRALSSAKELASASCPCSKPTMEFRPVAPTIQRQPWRIAARHCGPLIIADGGKFSPRAGLMTAPWRPVPFLRSRSGWVHLRSTPAFSHLAINGYTPPPPPPSRFAILCSTKRTSHSGSKPCRKRN